MAKDPRGKTQSDERMEGNITAGQEHPYDEDLWNKHKMPVNEYGFTKLAAECVFVQPGTIVRTVGLYGGERDDFAKSIIARASLGETDHAMRNLSFNPTYVPHLAAALLQLAEMKESPAVVNVAGSEILSRYEFALRVCEVFGLDTKLVIPTTKVDGWLPPRPAKAGLKLNLAKKIGLELHDVTEGLTAMRELM